MRRRIIGLRAMTFPPLVFRIPQQRELFGRQQRLDSGHRGRPVRLEAGPDLLQLIARGLDLARVLRGARLAGRLLRGINPGLVGGLIFLTGFGEVVLDRLQLDPLPVGESHLLLETGRQGACSPKDRSFSNATWYFNV
jgi:hypothetical protein